MNTTDIPYEKIKLLKGIKQEPGFIRDINVIKSISPEKYSKIIDYVLEPFLKNEPMDSEAFNNWIKDLGESKEKVASAWDMTRFLFGKAVYNELTKEDFESDLENLGLGAHKEYLVNKYVNTKDKFKSKFQEREIRFHNKLESCEWRLDSPIKVSFGKPYTELIVTINISYNTQDGESESISLEGDINSLRYLVNKLENCLEEAAKWQIKKK